MREDLGVAQPGDDTRVRIIVGLANKPREVRDHFGDFHQVEVAGHVRRVDVARTAVGDVPRARLRVLRDCLRDFAHHGGSFLTAPYIWEGNYIIR